MPDRKTHGRGQQNDSAKLKSAVHKPTAVETKKWKNEVPQVNEKEGNKRKRTVTTNLATKSPKR